MKSFRFSPILDQERMMAAITYIHFACHDLCHQSLGEYLPVAGNVGVFCHFDEEFNFLLKLRESLADPTDSIYFGKYFKLYVPIVIPAKGDIPKSTYKFLYIRKPDSQKNQVGDIDFYLDPVKHLNLKQSLNKGKLVKGARVLANRPELDFIELYNPSVDALAYIGTKNWQ